MRETRNRGLVAVLLLAISVAIAATSSAAASNLPTLNASSTAGTKCAKSGSTRKVAGVQYTCTKSGKTLQWAKTILPAKSTSSTSPSIASDTGTNGPLGYSKWVISISPNPVRPSQAITITTTITCGPIMSLSGTPRYPDMNTWANIPGFNGGSMGVPVLTSGGNTATFKLVTTAPKNEGTFPVWSYGRDFDLPNACFGTISEYTQTKNIDLVVSATAISSTNSVVAGVTPKDGAACSTVGDSYSLTVGRLECRQISDLSGKWVTLLSNPAAAVMPAGGSNLGACQLREARNTKYQPWNVGFPRGDVDNTPMLPTSGQANVQLIAVDFPDTIGTASELTDADAEIAEFNRWFAFTSNNTLSFNWQFPKRWFRMPKTWAAYGSPKGDREKTRQIATDIINAADPFVDFTNTKFVLFLFPKTITGGADGVGWANFDLSSSEGAVKNFFGGGEFFYKNNYELWSYWVHEWGHPMGLSGHTPRSNISIMDNQNGSSVVLNVWDSFLAGWLDASQLYCMPISTNSLEISLTPLERLQSATRGLIVPISSTNALVVESHRAEGWGKRMGAGNYGVSVYWVDTTMDTNRYAGSDGSFETDTGDRWADNIIPSGATRKFDLLLQGDTVTYKGVTVTFTKTGDVDTVKITK